MQFTTAAKIKSLKVSPTEDGLIGVIQIVVEDITPEEIRQYARAQQRQDLTITVTSAQLELQLDQSA